MRVRSGLVWLDCSCVWDTCRGAVCCSGCGRLMGCCRWQSLPQSLPLLPIGPLPSFRMAAQVARALRAGTNGFRPDVATDWPRLAASMCLNGRNSVAAGSCAGAAESSPGGARRRNAGCLAMAAGRLERAYAGLDAPRVCQDTVGQVGLGDFADSRHCCCVPGVADRAVECSLDGFLNRRLRRGSCRVRPPRLSRADLRGLSVRP